MNLRKFTQLSIALLALLFFMPGLIQGQNQGTIDIAIKHYQEQRADYDLTEQDISNYRISDNYSSRHNGVTHIYLQQQYENISVIPAISNFNILANGEVLSMNNRFIRDLATKVNTTTPSITPEEAIASVIDYFDVITDGTIELERKTSEKEYIFKKEGLALEDIKVRLMYQPYEKKEVRLVWQVNFYELTAQNWYVASVDALTNEVIYHYNQVLSCNFGKPNHSCREEHHFHPAQAFQTNWEENPPSNVENAYNVLAMPIESPNHGVHSLVVNPADVDASPFGWHDTDGQPGAEYTITRGNNVHAYHDIFSLNSAIGDEPDGGDSLVFDLPFDATNFLVFQQRDQATINLFYWNNIIHDVWYHYGFDEVSGNFQVNNYGNGGQGTDHVLAEALDGSGTNNANFATPEDGGSGRMQMYFWGGGQTAEPPSLDLTVLNPQSVAGIFPMGLGNFGGDLPDTLTSEIVLVDDGSGNTADACQNIQNGAEVAGKIALIDRGACGHGGKASRAEAVGAIAVIFCNNGNNVYSPNGGGAGAGVTIPIITLGQQSCNVLKTVLDDTLVVQIVNSDIVYVIPDPGPTGRDGDYDNGIIVHEYTHGISNRLTGGPNQGGCLSNQEQMGEGWSDWFGLVMQTTEDNYAEQIRGIGTYATGEPTDGPGIRNFPYSRDIDINPQTYIDVISTNVPHGVGEIWSAMIWDLYWNFIDIYGFDSDFYHGTGGNNMVMQLVLDGMKFQPCDPTFPEGRDAILQADMVNYDGAHQCLIWETFARRGLGYSASAGGNEAFDIPPSCDPVLKISKSAPTTIDAGGVINYTLTIRNDTPEFLASATVEDVLPAGATFVVGSSTCGGTVDDGILTIPLTDFASGDEIICNYQMQTNSIAPWKVVFEDDVEGLTSIWSKTANLGSSIWLPSNITPHGGTRAWKAGNPGVPTDQLLTLKESVLIDGNNPHLAFWHRYMTDPNLDGGVVEISKDEGVNWEDLGPYFVSQPYNGSINNDLTNPLNGRDVFTGNSNGYVQSVANLSAFKGNSIIIRFRFATNEGNNVLVNGWTIDDIQLYNDLSIVVNEACLNSNITVPICNATGTLVFGEPTNTTELNFERHVQLFPNPTSGKVELQWDREISEINSIRLSSINGLELNNWRINPFTSIFSIDLSQYGPGLYMVQILTKENFVTKKIVVK